MSYSSSSVSWIDRIASAISYLTAGWVGLLYCIFLYLTKRNISSFMRFNVMQSIFFALAFYLLSVLLEFGFKILSHIPLIQVLVSWIQLIFLRPFLFQYSLLSVCVNIFILYFVINCLLGRKPDVLTKLIK